MRLNILKNRFNRLFIIRESRIFYNLRNLNTLRNLAVIYFIMVLSFIAMGFSCGSLFYISKQMKDPFVRWLDINIPFKDGNYFNKIANDLNEEKMKYEYGYSTVNGFNIYTLYFLNSDSRFTYQMKGRTIDYKSDLLNKIFANNNYVAGRPFNNVQDIGIIGTEDMFLKLNCLEKPFILMPMETSAGVYENVPIPIIGIVKELPTSVDFITTDYFYNQRIMSLNSNPFLPQEHDEIDLYIQCDSNSINKATEAIKANLEKNIKKKYDPLFSISNHTQTRFVGFNVNISLYPGTANRNDLEMLYKYIRDGYEEYNLEAFKIYQYHFNKIINENKYDMISIDFIKFNEIKKFQEYFQRKYQIKIDMSKIEQKNIYSLISSASIATSVILMCFTIFSISTYLNQYMKNYLMSNRINLGTLMAFGIANITLIQIYLYISLIYLNILTIGAFITASAIGYSGFISYMFSHIGQFQLENKIYLFSTMNIYVLCGIIVMVVCVSIPLYFNIKNVISNTPGDLINERID